MKTFIGSIEQASISNTNFRNVLSTGQHAQLVVMSLLPNEDIGLEVHEIVDQFIRIETGTAKVILDGQEHSVKDGDAFIVAAGVKHNVINTSSENQLKLYTIYSPPHHKDGTVHKTKAEAEADKTDHI